MATRPRCDAFDESVADHPSTSTGSDLEKAATHALTLRSDHVLAKPLVHGVGEHAVG